MHTKYIIVMASYLIFGFLSGVKITLAFHEKKSLTVEIMWMVSFVAAVVIGVTLVSEIIQVLKNHK